MLIELLGIGSLTAGAVYLIAEAVNMYRVNHLFDHHNSELEAYHKRLDAIADKMEQTVSLEEISSLREDLKELATARNKTISDHIDEFEGMTYMTLISNRLRNNSISSLRKAMFNTA
jgi:hypothetical protein